MFVQYLGCMLATTAPEATEFEPVIGGMTCAACATRVQAKLNKIDGVAATVNLATERPSAAPCKSLRGSFVARTLSRGRRADGGGPRAWPW